MVVEWFPKTLAPNTITFIGFMINLIPSILIIHLYGYSLSGEIDNWFCYLIGICYGIYITLDNCDGK